MTKSWNSTAILPYLKLRFTVEKQVSSSLRFENGMHLTQGVGINALETRVAERVSPRKSLAYKEPHSSSVTCEGGHKEIVMWSMMSSLTLLFYVK